MQIIETIVTGYTDPLLFALGIAILALSYFAHEQEGKTSPSFVNSVNKCLPYVMGFFCLYCFLVFFKRSSLQGTDQWMYDHDLRYWYTAGKCWLAGVSPYDAETFRQMWAMELGKETLPKYSPAFVYPPVLMLLSVPFAILDWDIARSLFRALSTFAFISTCLFSVGLLKTFLLTKRENAEIFLFVGFSCLLLSPAQAIYQAQISIIVVLGIVLTLYGWQKSRKIIFLIGFVLASIKIQISLLPLLFVVFVAPNRYVLEGVFVTAILSILSISVIPFHDIFVDFQNSLHVHMGEQEWNQLHHYEGVAALFGATTIGRSALYVGVLVGIVTTLIFASISRKRGGSKLTSLDIKFLLIIFALSSTMMPLHRYDQVIHIPLLFSLVALIGFWRRLAIIFAIFIQEYTWDYRITMVANKLFEKLNPDRIYQYVDEIYFVPSIFAALFSSVLLFIVIYAFVYESRDN